MTTILDMCHSQKVDGWMDIWMNSWMNRMERKKGWKEKGGEEAKKEGLMKGRNGQEDKQKIQVKDTTDIYKNLPAYVYGFTFCFFLHNIIL